MPLVNMDVAASGTVKTRNLRHDTYDSTHHARDKREV